MTTLRVATVGFDKSESTYVKTTVELASGLDIGGWHYVDTPDVADVVLANTASGSGRALMQSRLAAPGDATRIVACSPDGEAVDSHTLSLRRPVTYAALVGLLRRVQAELAYAPAVPDRNVAASAPRAAQLTERPATDGKVLARQTARELTGDEDVAVDFTESQPPFADEKRAGDPEPPTAGTEAVSDTPRLQPELEKHQSRSPSDHTPATKMAEGTVSQPEGGGKERGDKDRPARKFFEVARMLGLIKRAMGQGQVTAIMHRRYPTVWIYPDQGVYATPSHRALVPAMFRTLASEFTLRPMGSSRAREPLPSWEKGRLGRLLYLAALYGSEGRLREGCHFGDKLRLVAKPDFTTVPGVTEHRAIARFMLKRSADISTIAAETGVPAETVIDFCNACDEVLLIERESEIPQPGGVQRAVDPHNAELYLTDDPWRIGSASTARSPGLLRRFQALFHRSA